MRYSRVSLAPAGFGQVLPSVTLEFLGSVNSTIRLFSLLRHGLACPGHPRLASDSAETWMPGTRPGMTAWLVNPRLRLDVGDLVGHRVGVHRPVVDRDLAGRV